MYMSAALTFYLFLLISSVSSFCIYNKHDDETFYWIRQTAGHGTTWRLKGNRFLAEHLGRDEKTCCHYSNYDCNEKRDQYNLLHFAVQRTSGDKKQDMFDINCPAGGYIVFKGTWDNPIIQVFYANDEVFHHSFEWNPTNARFYSKHKSNSGAITAALQSNSTRQ